MKRVLISGVAVLTGCAGAPTSDVFNTRAVDYEKVQENPVRAKAKVFIKNGYACDYMEKNPESGALAVAVGTIVIKKAVEYGADYLKGWSDYLKADVVVKGSTLLAYNKGDSVWPLEKDLSIKAELLKRQLEIETARVRSDYVSASKKNKESDEALKELITQKEKAVKEAFAKKSPAEIKNSDADMCVLLVAGNYKGGAGQAALERFLKNTGATGNRISAYQSASPGINGELQDRPFKDLQGDPAMVLEMHIVVSPDTENVRYTLVPINLFYPHPLHKGTANGLERKLTITTRLGDHQPVITLDHMVSGNRYGVFDLVNDSQYFSAPISQQFQQIDVSIAEGPDKMPTAQVLDATVENKDKVIDYLIEKLTQKYGSDEQKAALKK